jgi:hypothetical protein
MRENTIGNAQAKAGQEGRLRGTVMSLALLGGILVSLAAPARVATSFVEVGRPPAAAPASSATAVSPGEANADQDTLELQLD